MARQRYTTTSPTFSNDFMFQAPWELAMSAIQFNEKQVDTIFDQANLLGDATMNINFLEADRANVEAERQIIDGQVKEVTDALRADPTQWKKQMPRIRQIGQSLQSNLRTGNLGKIQGSYTAYQNFLKNYEDLRKKDPQEFDRVASYYLNQWKNTNEKGSLTSQFNPGAVYAPKSLTDKEFVDILKDFKAEEFTTLNGLYKIDNKVVTKDQVAAAAINLATSNPDFANFVRQRQMLGDSSYLSPMFINVDNTTGQPITSDEAAQRQAAFTQRALEIEKLLSNPTTRAKYTQEQIQQLQSELVPSFTTQLNPQNAIAQQATALGNVYSFRSQKVSGNEPAIMQYREAQSNARQAQSIAAANERQKSQQAFDEKMLDKRQANEQANIKLKAELTPTKGKAGSKAKDNSPQIPEVTQAGESVFPTWGTGILQDADLIKGFSNGGAASNYDRMIASSKVSTITDAAATAALNKSSNRNDKDVRGIVDFISNALRSGNSDIAKLVAEKDNEGLAEAYFAQTRAKSSQDRGNVLGSMMEAIGRAGSPGAPNRNAQTPALDAYGNASNEFDALFKKVNGAVSTYTNSYNQRNDTLREPKAQSDFFGINTRSPETRQLQNNMNVNIGDYQFFKTDDLINPVEGVSEVKITNITSSFGGMPVGFLVQDSKGNKLKAIPKSANRAQTDLDFISQNSPKIFSSADTSKTNLYFGNQGKNANLASAFDYVASVGDTKQIVPIATSSGKSFKVTKEIVNVKGENKLKITIDYPGTKPTQAIADPKAISSSNQNDVIIQMLDKKARENNIDYYIR